MQYVLGVDGGMTKTIALVADSNGTILGASRSGAFNIYVPSPEPEQSLDRVAQAVHDALAAAKLPTAAVDRTVLSMSGADWPEDFDFIKSELAWRCVPQPMTVVNDAVGGLYAGLPDGPGVAVICGTGGATAARGSDGTIWHASFWQWCGGADQLTERALHAVWRAEIGMEQPTRLAARLLDHFAQPSVEALLHLFTSRTGPKPSNIGRFTRVLLDEASGGDPVALALVQQHGAELGEYALAAARRVKIDRLPWTLVLSGGVLRHPSQLLAQAIIGRVQGHMPATQVVNTRFEPVVGALFLALERGGIAIDESLLERLIPSLPAPAFFAT